MWKKFKVKVVELVRWAEGMSGKTGKEKKKWVLNELSKWLKLPFPLNLLVNIIASKLIDQVVEKLNWLTDHEDWEAVAATAEEIMPVIKASVSKEAKESMSVDERLKALYEQYGIAVPADVEKRAEEKNYFTDDEFACKCCGLNKLKPQLKETANIIRRHLGVPVTVNSGTRCPAKNASAGGSSGSKHMTGEAADITAKGIDADTLWHTVKSLYIQGNLPELGGLGRYNGHVHIDVAKVASGLREWDERK